MERNRELIEMLERLQTSAQLRANDLMRHPEHRAKSQGAADAYGGAIMLIRQFL